MTRQNIYAPPSSQVADGAPEERSRLYFIRRLFVTTAFGFPIFMSLVLFVSPMERWATGALGAVLMALLSGAFGACIPTRKKFLYVPPAIVLGLLVAYIVGTSGK